MKGIEPEVRAAAKTAARRAGMTLGEWLNSVILDQNEHIIDSPLLRNSLPEERYLSSAPQDPPPPPPDSTPGDDRPRQPAAAGARRDDSAMRLQDIARQLADLAQKERQSASIQPFPTPRAREEDGEVFARVLERIDDNERQTVEAFTAVNERLSVLGQQIATLPRGRLFDRPEDVPGYSALESAIRNVVEHIEVSEKRTRDSLKSMQDRLSELAEQVALQPRAEDMQRTAPVLSSLEARIAELSNRLQRTESAVQAGLPDSVRMEFGQIAQRIDSVKAAADQMAKQAQAAAAGVARSELREIETRVLAMLQEAQAAVSARNAAPEGAQLRGELNTLSAAVEQLSARVTQGGDKRPLAEMERRVAELGIRLDQVASAAGGGDHLRDMEDRIAELGQRLDEAVAQRADLRTFDQIERNIAAVDERVARTEDQLRHIETMEHAIRELYGSLEQTRNEASQMADDASRSLQRVLPPGEPTGPSPELRALEEGLRAVRESAAGAERRNQETLAAVHETLSQIVEKIAELEAAPARAAAPAYATVEHPAAPAPGPALESYDAPPAHDGLSAPENAAPPLPAGDDFIAAARRAAQAAATRPSSLRAEFGPGSKQEEAGRSSVLGRFRRSPRADEPLAGTSKPEGTGSRRRVLLLAAMVLLVAVSAFAFNRLVMKPAPVPGTTIEQPAQPAPGPNQQGRIDMPSDPVITGVLPPPALASPAKLPPPEIGNAALRQAAAGGNAKAQFVVATRYLEGDGTPQDAAKAAFWYEQAATNGLAPAQYRIATMFQLGKGVAQDAPSALYWYEKAARQGNVKSMYNAAVLMMEGKVGRADQAKMLSYFAAAAKHGMSDSQFNLAILYERGMGAAPDIAKAYYWYSVAAQQGDAQAADRAAVLAKSLTPTQRGKIDTQVAAWAPETLVEAANVVASADPAWITPGSTVLASESAVPMAEDPVSDDLVTEAQKLLIQLGFNIGTPDGRMGARTVTALRLFQLKSGLAVTGELTPEVLDVMRAKTS